MRAKGTLLLMIALALGHLVGSGARLYPNAFYTTGRMSGDWYWLETPASYAQWEFHALPASLSEQVVLDVLACAAAQEGSVPAEFAVVLTLTSGGRACWSGRVLLRRVQSAEGGAVYFGQLPVSRRELALGSQLIVRADGSPSGLRLGFHPGSLRVQGNLERRAVPGGQDPFAILWATVDGMAGGAGGVLADDPPAPTVRPGTPAPIPLSLHNTDRMEDAPFLAPGSYRGQLGWPGPYQPMNSRDWCRVNLRPGQVVRLTLEVGAGCPCSLHLFDPYGREVGSVTGGERMGLEYRADVGGAWYVLIACREGCAAFPYLLAVHIENGG